MINKFHFVVGSFLTEDARNAALSIPATQLLCFVHSHFVPKNAQHHLFLSIATLIYSAMLRHLHSAAVQLLTINHQHFVLRLLQMFLSEHLPPVHLCCTKVHSHARSAPRRTAATPPWVFFLFNAVLRTAAHILETLRVLVPRDAQHFVATLLRALAAQRCFASIRCAGCVAQLYLIQGSSSRPLLRKARFSHTAPQMFASLTLLSWFAPLLTSLTRYACSARSAKRIVARPSYMIPPQGPDRRFPLVDPLLRNQLIGSRTERVL